MSACCIRRSTWSGPRWVLPCADSAAETRPTSPWRRILTITLRGAWVNWWSARRAAILAATGEISIQGASEAARARRDRHADRPDLDARLADAPLAGGRRRRGHYLGRVRPAAADRERERPDHSAGWRDPGAERVHGHRDRDSRERRRPGPSRGGPRGRTRRTRSKSRNH